MNHDVIIIGGGPAGLSAARHLLASGVRDVVVIERNPECGGLPRFCLHRGWGALDFGRLWRGPRYARALVEAAAGATFLTNCAVTALEPDGVVRVNTPGGPRTLRARAVLLATGIREMPRSARLIGGTRPWGVMNTGAFQEMVRFQTLPFRAPVIIGSELVAFSALETARHAGLRPVALLEENSSLSVPAIVGAAARLRYQVPVRTGCRLVEICGQDRVEAIIVEDNGARRRLRCDSIVLSGRFVPETALVDGRTILRDLDGTRGPVIDNFYRCTDPRIFAAGNVLRGVEHSGYVAHEGRSAAAAILRALRDDLPPSRPAIAVEGRNLRYVYPQRIVPSDGKTMLFGRSARGAGGDLVARDASGRELARRSVGRFAWPRLTLEIPTPDVETCDALILEREHSGQ
ncbi:NAD(P)/FAD-dependent oxidoreductase [Gluconacetobacter tumulisoli]|uniref:FAD-dependent oxidoreductase n=1 Tax=Gluconacetobacter tumulisoli TaxID=1286189 RepID=A0A7W4K9F5_9PROT|nr:FAD-dependent oxidoreductase [Gluconacetobacter tumulisoli]MBB2202775.1 FAD-dependent oxidoreductase [Gluconacetobacter tumulisoli]